MTYSIHENNLSKLVEKLKKIESKCNKYGLAFNFEVTGEEFKKVEKHMERFIIVDVDGKAIIEDWRFIATLEHTIEGNVIRSYVQDVEIPVYFRTCEAKCDHCNSNRYRKDTYIVQNVTTGELKQVGKSCLKDYTNGWSAEAVARYLSYFDTLEEYDASGSFGGGFTKHYYNREEVLLAAVELTSKIGFVSKQKAIDEEKESTVAKAIEFMSLTPSSEVQKEMAKIGYKPDTDENKAVVKNMLAWLEVQEANGQYIENLQILCKKEYLEYRDLGIVVSLPAAYHKALVKAEENKKRIEESKSEFVGTIKERIVIENVSIKCVARYETDYGVTKVYRMVDEIGNIYVWKSGNYIEDAEKITIKGTVKAHSEFRGEKQTELTRCKVQ